MAYVGMRYFAAAVIDTEHDNAPPTYKPGKIIGQARRADISWTKDDAELPADDMIVEAENTTVGGNIAIEMADLNDEAQIMLFGYEAGTDGEIVEHVGKSPNVGFGYIRTKKSGKAEGEWLYKVVFSPGNENAATKDRTTSFQTPTADGKIMLVYTDANGNIAPKVHKNFDTVGEALTWLKAKAGIQGAG